MAHSETIENVCRIEIKNVLLYLFHLENFNDFIITETIPIVDQGWTGWKKILARKHSCNQG